MVLHADALDKTRQPVAGDRVRHDRSARVIPGDDRRHHRDDRIPVHLVAVWKHRRHSVHVRIKYDAQIRLVLQHRLSDRLHRLPVLRVWYMIRERTVGLEELTSRRVRTERIQHLLHKKAAGTVSRVHHDMQPCERSVIVIGIDTLSYLLLQKSTIYRDGVNFFHSGQISLHHGKPRSRLEHLRDIVMLQSAVPVKKLVTVPVKRQVARRDHDRPVKRKRLKHCRHEHRGRRHQTAVVYLCPRCHDSLRRRSKQAVRRDPRIMTDPDPQFIRPLSLFLRKPSDKATADQISSILGEIHILPRNPLTRDPAYVASVLKLHNISHLISSVKSGSDTEPFTLRAVQKTTHAPYPESSLLCFGKRQKYLRFLYTLIIIP